MFVRRECPPFSLFKGYRIVYRSGGDGTSGAAIRHLKCGRPKEGDRPG